MTSMTKKTAEVRKDIDLVYFFENNKLIGVTEIKRCDLEAAKADGWRIKYYD